MSINILTNTICVKYLVINIYNLLFAFTIFFLIKTRINFGNTTVFRIDTTRAASDYILPLVVYVGRPSALKLPAVPAYLL